MPALTDPQLEMFAQALLRNLINGMPRSKASEAAAREAKYKGSSLAPNARKRANRKDVKARMIELAAPKQAEIETEIAQNCDVVRRRMYEIAQVPFEPAMVKISDQINASTLLARMEGWLAAEKREHMGEDGGPIRHKVEIAFVAAGEK